MMCLCVERSAFKRVVWSALGRLSQLAVIIVWCWDPPVDGMGCLSRAPWYFGGGYDDGVGLSTEDAVLIALLHEACLETCY